MGFNTRVLGTRGSGLVTRTHAHRHTHSGGAWTVKYKWRAFVVFISLQSREPPECCGDSWPAGLGSQRDKAVSRSSTSSAAVASIFLREKSLMGSPSTIFQVLSCGRRQREETGGKKVPWRTSGHQLNRPTHLDLDGEGVDEVLWDAVGVSSSVDTHGDELTLSGEARSHQESTV